MFLYTCTYKFIKKNQKKIDLTVNKFIFIHNCINSLQTSIYLQKIYTLNEF